MKIVFVVLGLIFSVGKSYAEECSSPAAIKFTCLHFDFYRNKDILIEVDFPEGTQCDVAPLSGTISLPAEGKKKTVYSPLVVFKFLTREIQFAEITFKQTLDAEKELELICTDIKFSK